MKRNDLVKLYIQLIYPSKALSEACFVVRLRERTNQNFQQNWPSIDIISPRKLINLWNLCDFLKICTSRTNILIRVSYCSAFFFYCTVFVEQCWWTICFAQFTMATRLQTAFYFKALSHLSLSSLIKTGTSIDNPITCLVNTLIASYHLWELHIQIKSLCFKLALRNFQLVASCNLKSIHPSKNT